MVRSLRPLRRGRLPADRRGEHAQAVSCFAMLYELLEALESGEEIIFAEEAGSWMIPTDHKAWLKAYLTSLAATTTPETFAAAALPMIERDSGHSFADRAARVSPEGGEPAAEGTSASGIAAAEDPHGSDGLTQPWLSNLPRMPLPRQPHSASNRRGRRGAALGHGPPRERGRA